MHEAASLVDLSEPAGLQLLRRGHGLSPSWGINSDHSASSSGGAIVCGHNPAGQRASTGRRWPRTVWWYGAAVPSSSVPSPKYAAYEAQSRMQPIESGMVDRRVVSS